MPWVAISANQDQEQRRSRQRSHELSSFHLSGCVLCRTELSGIRIVRPLPQSLESLLYRMPRVYGFVIETHSFLHRMVARYRRRYGVWFLSGMPLSELEEDGLRYPNIRTRACIDDMRNYAETHPWATILDLETYRDAWQAGVEWAESNYCKASTEDSVHHS